MSDLPDKMQVDKLFKFNGFVSESKLIVSYMPIHGLDVQNFLKAYMIDFPDRTRVQIFCGTHGARDGSFGHTTLHEMGDMINQYKQVVAHVLAYDKKRAKLVKEKGIRFDVRFVGELPGFDTYQIHFKELRATLQDMMDSEDPYIVILAFCFTNVSILRDMLMEMGFLAILSSKAERSLLSNGTCHRMTLGQQTPINAAGKDHIHTKDELQSAQTKNMFLFGSTGTGKTEILKHLARMRIQFYKRIYKENSQKINAINSKMIMRMEVVTRKYFQMSIVMMKVLPMRILPGVYRIRERNLSIIIESRRVKLACQKESSSKIRICLWFRLWRQG